VVDRHAGGLLADCNGVDQGEWVVVDSSTNGGGETTLTLRKWTGP